MALKGLDIFKLTPKTNCKDCGNATCMAFSMKVAQGGIELSKCPHLSEEALATLGAATAPPMVKIFLEAASAATGDKKTAGGEQATGNTASPGANATSEATTSPGATIPLTLGGETVLFRHEKTFVSKTLFAVTVFEENFDKKIDEINKINYDRLGENMFVEFIHLPYNKNATGYSELARRSSDTNRALILECDDTTVARAALEVVLKDSKDAAKRIILNGANASSYEEMNKLAVDFDVILGVSGSDLDELYDTTAALEKLGNKKLVLDVGCVSVKDAFAGVVQIRRAALKDKNRTFGYPSLVNVGKLAKGNEYLQTALASLFILKYGSIIIMENMTYPQALPLFGLRQNIFTDPQKPMKVEPGIYPLNGADENSICVTTVDFALTYFVVTGELERSGVPMNLLITDAGGYSVLTAWAAGKLSASSLAKFFKEFEIEEKIKNRTLVIPGKVAVLKGEIEEALPGWKILVGPGEAIEAVKFFKELK